MHKAQKFALGLLAAAAVATASDVVQLKKDTFDDFVKTNDLVLAECKFAIMTLRKPQLKLTGACFSLRSVVRSLQSPRPRVRGGCDYPEGEEHQACQGGLHRRDGSLPTTWC